MALHRDFPRSPYDVLIPEQRWFPAAEELRTDQDKLLPPLVARIREEVKAWRDSGYVGATETSRALLTWWFDTHHLLEQGDGTQSQFRLWSVSSIRTGLPVFFGLMVALSARCHVIDANGDDVATAQFAVGSRCAEGGNQLRSRPDLSRTAGRIEHRNNGPGRAHLARAPRRRQGRTEIAYLVTSLPASKAGPTRLLGLVRGHWAIENRLHHVPDVSMVDVASALAAVHSPPSATSPNP